jgi:alpha-beta hydrolase superfamily lysophospholipase
MATTSGTGGTSAAVSSSSVAPDREELIEGAGGVKLHLSHFVPRVAPRFALVAMHGFTVYAGPYGRIWKRLAEAGVAVTAFDLRGHGRSEGRRGHVSRFGVYHQDLALVLDAVRRAHPTLPQGLLGHSFGGTIALDAVLGGQLAVQPDRLVLATPFIGRYMKVAGWKLAFSGVASTLWPTFAPDNEIKPEDGSRNPDVVAAFFKDPLIHHVASARWFTETTAAQARIVENASRLTVPTLLLSVGEDRVVSTPPVEALAAAAPAFIQAKHYRGLYHELFLEPEWEAVASDISGWLTSPITKQMRSEAAPPGDPAILPSHP